MKLTIEINTDGIEDELDDTPFLGDVIARTVSYGLVPGESGRIYDDDSTGETIGFWEWK